MRSESNNPMLARRKLSEKHVQQEHPSLTCRYISLISFVLACRARQLLQRYSQGSPGWHSLFNSLLASMFGPKPEDPSDLSPPDELAQVRNRLACNVGSDFPCIAWCSGAV